METECFAPETTQSNYSEQNCNENQEMQTPKDLLLWCSALKITPEEYKSMSDKELILRINNLKGKLKLKIAKALIARQKEQLDRIRAQVSENNEEKQNINKYKHLFNKEKFRAVGGEEILRDNSFSETEEKFNSHKCTDPVHSTLPKVLRGFRRKNHTDFWKVISKAAADVERIYGGESNQGFNNFSFESFGNEDGENNFKNYDKKNCNTDDRSKNTASPRFLDHEPIAPKKLLNNPGTSAQPTFLQFRKVPRTELPTTNDGIESPQMVHLNIKRSPELSQFSSRRESSLARRRPHIEAAIIIKDKIIDENSKQNYQKKENMIEVQSIQSYEIDKDSNQFIRKNKPFTSYGNQMPQIESPSQPTNVIKYKQWDYPFDVNFSQSDISIQDKLMQNNSNRTKSSSKQRQTRQMDNVDGNPINIRLAQHDRINNGNECIESDHIDEDSITSSKVKKTLPIRDGRTHENSEASHKPGRRIKLIQNNNVQGNIIGIRTIEDNRISGDIIQFEGVEGNQINSNSQSSSLRRPIRVIQDSKINGNILGIEGFEDDLVDGNAIEFQAIDDNRNSRARRRRA